MSITAQVDLIGMEACAGSHFLGKALSEQGHEVPPHAGAVRKAVREDQQERLHRQVFKKVVGLTPTEYRSRFGLVGTRRR